MRRNVRGKKEEKDLDIDLEQFGQKKWEKERAFCSRDTILEIIASRPMITMEVIQNVWDPL